MKEGSKNLTVSENVDLAVAEIERIEKSLRTLHRVLGGNDKRLKRIQVEVSAMREDLQKLKGERQAHDRR